MERQVWQSRDEGKWWDAVSAGGWGEIADGRPRIFVVRNICAKNHKKWLHPFGTWW